jgi:spore coat polysaccharide biosynthesis protein SpsF (cytidylyltransferase family)
VFIIEITRIKVDSYDLDYMQFLHFEKATYQEILGFILLEKQKGYSYSKENYEHFMNEYKETSMKWTLTFNTLVEKYAPEYYKDTSCDAQFDFDSKELIITKRGGKNESC